MSRAWEFELPTRIQFGRGGLRKIGETVRSLGRSALLVGYRERTGLDEVYERAESLLAKAGVAVSHFGVDPEPEAESIQVGADAAREGGVDVVVAVGGGSVIDAAKAVAGLARCGGTLWQYTGGAFKGPRISDALAIVAVPTTAGTGSEVSSVAVFTFRGVGSRPEVPLKGTISSPVLYPRVALVDPDLSVGAPPLVTARCGADALGHAIEARISRRAGPISSALACRAVGQIYRNLRRAVDDPSDPQPREELALAATFAGAAFSAAGVVVNHAIAHALGAVLGTPHGEAVAIGTPVHLRYNAQQCQSEYAELADCCGIEGDTEAARAARFVEEVTELLRSVGLPQEIEARAGTEGDLIEQLVDNAIESTSVVLSLNPRKVDRDALAGLFREILPGAIK